MSDDEPDTLHKIRRTMAMAAGDGSVRGLCSDFMGGIAMLKTGLQTKGALLNYAIVFLCNSTCSLETTSDL